MHQYEQLYLVRKCIVCSTFMEILATNIYIENKGSSWCVEKLKWYINNTSTNHIGKSMRQTKIN